MRQFALRILIRIMTLDTESARKSFRAWTNLEDNKNRFFERIKNLANQFSTCFLDQELSLILTSDLKETDIEELKLSLEWLTLLCQNDKHWQDYLSVQDNSARNHNIILAVIELMRTSVLRLNHEYVIDLLRVLVRFIVGSINGRNQTLSDQYVNAGVINYSMEILKVGFYPEEVEFVKKISKESSLMIMKNENGNPITDPQSNMKRYLEILDLEENILFVRLEKNLMFFCLSSDLLRVY